MPIPTTTARALGCLLWQLAGDALGSLVEFQSPEEIRHSYPEGVRDLANGGTWDTLAGQRPPPPPARRAAGRRTSTGIARG